MDYEVYVSEAEDYTLPGRRCKTEKPDVYSGTATPPGTPYDDDNMDYHQLGFGTMQVFHMRCQRRIFGVHWYEHVTNIAVAYQTNLPHIAPDKSSS